MFTIIRTDQRKSWIASWHCVVMYLMIAFRYSERTFSGLVFLKQRVGILMQKWASRTHCWDLHFPHENKMLQLFSSWRSSGLVVLNSYSEVERGLKESWERSPLYHTVNKNNKHMHGSESFRAFYWSKSAYVSFTYSVQKSLHCVVTIYRCMPKHCPFKRHNPATYIGYTRRG